MIRELEKNYEFIEKETLKSVFFFHEIYEKPNKAYRFFMENDAEVLYVVDDSGMIYGLISIGDMYRYYKNEEKEMPINQKFTYLEEASDVKGAEKFFQRVETIHEVPVIKEKVLLGIIRKKEGMATSRGRLRSYLKTIRGEVWEKEKLEQFNQLVDMDILYYNWPTMRNLSKEDQEVIEERRRDTIGGLDYFLRMSEPQQENFMGGCRDKEYIEHFKSNLKQLRLSPQNGVIRYNDCHNETFNISDGHRQISNKPGNAVRRIWMFGPCIVFGSYVCDNETIEYYLQDFLISNGYNNYEVVNSGNSRWYMFGGMFTEQMSSDDIVIIVTALTDIYSSSDEIGNETILKRLGYKYQGDLSEIYCQINNPIECMMDDPTHCNYKVNKKIAERMFSDLLPKLTKDNGNIAPRVALQNYFIPYDVIEYYEEYIEKYELHKEPKWKTGAIVMNCNPFTLGHRYLIEQACAQVDILYVFVVEEDKSYFKFEDRIEMVRQGTQDMDKVRVLPSGKYIISKETFAQYFEKDQIIVEVDDMDYDVRIFGEVVADMLGITCRFVGEEPFDKVTREYNETMKRILPEYNIELIEIPRKENDGICISASRVRKYLEQGEAGKAYNLLPESTRQYLKRNY